jgi:alpha-N-arabinofuranosidase
MIAPVDWDKDGWPVVNGGKPIENPMTVPTPPNYQEKPVDNKAWKDCFQGPELDRRWAYLRNPVLENYSLGNGLTLRGAAVTLDDCASPTFVGVRQGEFCSQVEVSLTVDQLAEGARLGLSVFHVPQHHYDLFVTRREGQLCAVLRRRVVDMVVESAPVALPEGQPIQLRIDSARLGYTFYAGAAGQPLAQVGTGCTQLLSTEVTICTFTGCFYGMFAEGASQGTFQEFTFTPLPEEA